jgi:antitoxin (DNA-binding transcriptional repressor) of toxin-antitoxin stability system
MDNRVIRVSDTEAVGDFRSLLDEVRLGAEVEIEHDARPVAVLRAVEPARRSISECIALAEAHAKELGSEPTLDPDFAADVADIVDNRLPLTPQPRT